MKTAILLLVLLPLLASAQDVQIAVWRHNATAAYSIIMDDFGEVRFGDTALIESTLANRDLRVSFALIANHDVSEPWWPECDNACKKALWELARRWHAAGHEFVNHSWNHAGGDWQTADYALQIDSSKALIERMIPGNSCRFFVFPGGVTGKDDDIAYMRTRGYIGVRNGSGDSEYKGVNTADLPDPFHTGSQFYATEQWAGGAEGLRTRVEQAIRVGGWAVNNTHSIGNDLGWMPMPARTWIDHLDFCVRKVETGALWVAPVQEVLMYLMERQNFSATASLIASDTLVVSLETEHAEINPSTLVANRSYNVPLTLLLSLPVSLRGTQLHVRQSGSLLTQESVDSGTIMFDAAPFDGPIAIHPVPVSAAPESYEDKRKHHALQSRMSRGMLFLHLPEGNPYKLTLYTPAGELVKRIHGRDSAGRQMPAGTGMLVGVLRTTGSQKVIRINRGWAKR